MGALKDACRPNGRTPSSLTVHELEAVDRTAREHLSGPGTLLLPHVFLVWGRKNPVMGETGHLCAGRSAPQGRRH